MAWVTCPHCGFTQIPAAQCLKCHKRLDRAPQPPPATPPPPPRGTGVWSRLPPRPYLLILAGLALVVITAILVWGARSGNPIAETAGLAPATPEPWSIDLTGRWFGKVTTTIAGTPSRPALRETFVETDRAGNIVGAGVILTDPGRGGAGAGYMTVPDGQRRVREIVAAVSAAPKGAALSLDFIPFAPWVPARQRSWHAVEGMRRSPEETTYVLVESVEPDYLVQAGINASGFLSYLYLSPAYAQGRGTDALSRAIHPEPGSSLRGFHNLIWDFSGAADFVGLQIQTTISGPAGSPDRVVLRRP
jgi:hypothetical protein